jgi:hypothetical protein
MSSRPLLPPRGLFVGTRLLFDTRLSPTLKETLLQVMAMAWGVDGHTTPPLTYPLLERLTGKDARTLRGHFALLKNYDAALRLQYIEPGRFIVCLAGWLFTNQVPAGGKDLPQHDEEINNLTRESEEEELKSNSLSLPLLNDSDQPGPKPAGRAQNGGNSADRRQKKGGKTAPGIARALAERLNAAGVFPSLMPEVAERAAQGKYSEDELNALLDWCAEDQPERPAALFIGRLRAGARAPEGFRQPACPRCGQRGKHASDCPRRYALD